MDSKAKSYDCKYAVEMLYRYNEVSSENIGNSVKEALEYRTVRGKFDPQHVHEDLQKLGVKEIILTNDHIEFKGNFKNLIIEKW